MTQLFAAAVLSIAAPSGRLFLVAAVAGVGLLAVLVAAESGHGP